ncbi:MAG TPA: tetratricopeptide repeat protein [Saprospiraceae bacterium]|nr:tetratricopeptide repeat protein [Saprospiraceae bacterium]
MPSIRQLAAIMFADIVGYTATMQQDEALALEQLEKVRKSIEKYTKLHHGRILEFRGDGVLCSFLSTQESVRAALAIQLEMRKEPAVPVRIAIHVGDVIMEGDAIYGDGVNIASRLESLAVAGSIFISGRVYDDIKNQKDLPAVPLGQFQLKNVQEQFALYALSNPGLVVPSDPDPDGKGMKVGPCCILVLPFVNLTRDPEQEYFSDGLTEELIFNLSRLKELRVISRTTSMKYKNTVKDVPEIQKETGAAYLVEGSIRKQGNKLRITAQFIDAFHDLHLWAENFTGTLDDVFDIQDKVASKITEALRMTLTADEKTTLQKRYTGNIEAFQLYLQGRYFWSKRNETAFHTAIRFFEKAIEKDPNYALAYAGLADCYNLLGEYTNYSRKDLYPKAKAAVKKAIELDNQLAEAHISLASILMLNEWDWEGAEREFRIGIELDPNYATAYHWYSELLLFTGRPEQGIQTIELASQLDPVSMAILKDLGISYYYARQYEKALEKAMATTVLDPDFITVHRLLSLCYHAMGEYDLALAENEKWGKMTHSAVKTLLAKAMILASAGKKEEAKAVMNEMQADHMLGQNDNRSVALIYVALGEFDTAFEWLNKALDAREESLCSLKVDPKLDAVRNDPRFNEIVRKIGLPV